jgi:CHAT domain-containing protein
VRLRRGDRLDWTGIAALAGESESERAVLSLFCAPKRLIAAVVRNGSSGPRICTVPMTTTALADLMSTYRLEVDRFGVEFGAETWDVPLQPLLTAVRENLDGVSELVVSPHGALHLLPWPALLDRAWSGLGSAPVVVVEPSLSVLAALQTPPPADVHGAAVFGDPLGDLRFSRREANRVAALLDVTPAIGDQATRRAVVDALKSAATVHIAAHVQTETTDPLESGLLLADGRLTARDILTEHLHAELVVLSACDSGRGASGGGDEFLGLTYALLQAGVRTLVVSLWPVEDQVTEELMVALHTYRRTSPTVAAALRKASTQIRTKRSHSWYWGAFVTVGRADLNRQVVE